MYSRDSTHTVPYPPETPLDEQFIPTRFTHRESESAQGHAIALFYAYSGSFQAVVKKIPTVWDLCSRRYTIGNEVYSSAHALDHHKPALLAKKNPPSHSVLFPNYLLQCSGTNVYVVTW